MRKLFLLVFLGASFFLPLYGNQEKPVPYSISISGGVSLGAYEAGLNWALVRYLADLRKARNDAPAHEISVTTGASAGSINAMLTAMQWCSKDAGGLPNTLDDNLFRNTWLGVGLDQLLPENGDSYKENDGVFTRNAMRRQIDDILGYLDSPSFRPGCSIKIGMTFTRKQPANVTVGEIKVPNQRFIATAEMYVDDSGYARFRNIPSLGKEAGNEIKFIEEKNGQILPERIVDAALASSAFPLAFGRVTMEYCTDENPSEDSQGKCPYGYAPAWGEFIDGGVFDNVPLGLARKMAEGNSPKVQDNDALPRPVTYIYLDPDNRRYHLSDPDEKVEEKRPTYGLKSQVFDFLGGMFVTTRKYELYSELRKDDWQIRTSQLFPQCDVTELEKYNRGVGESSFTYQEYKELLAGCAGENNISQLTRAKEDPYANRNIILSSRLAPVAGDVLWGFGAFFDQGFRVYDYYSGVYDGMIELARHQYQCSRNDDKSPCFQQLYDDFKIDEDANASLVFRLLSQTEAPLEKEFYKPKSVLKGETAKPSCQTSSPPMEKIYCALTQDNTRLENLSLATFQKNLVHVGYQPVEKNGILREIMDGRRWYIPPLRRSMTRLYNLEQTEASNGESNLSLQLIKAGYVGMTFVDEQMNKEGYLSCTSKTTRCLLCPFQIGSPQCETPPVLC